MQKVRWLLFLSLNAFGQASFEVATIKPHPEPINFSADPSVRGSTVTGTASTLLDIITTTYGLRYDQISGGPGWIKSDHYDLVAKAPGDALITKDQMQSMLQNLLADRFQLKIHRETREVPMYALVVGKSGPKFKVSPEAEALNGVTYVSNGSLHMKVAKGTMEQLARRLSGNGAGRPVIDQTGLTGLYSYTLDWANGTPAADSDAPSLLTAVQEQLGLKLESTKGSVEVLVIDHAEKPSAN